MFLPTSRKKHIGTRDLPYKVTIETTTKTERIHKALTPTTQPNHLHIMNTQDQRLEAAKLARQLNAPQTLAILNDDTKNSPIDVILKTADAEVGRDKLMSVILDSAYPYWAIGALRYLPNLGDYQCQLIAKAKLIVTPMDAPSFQNQVAAGNDVGLNIPAISKIKIYVACGASYTAYFSLWHFTPPYDNTWIKGTKDNGSSIPVCQSDTKDILFFSTPQQPINAGDVVMMFVHVNGGVDKPTNFWFTYDPHSNATAEIDCHGGTVSASFTYVVSGS